MDFHSILFHLAQILFIGSFFNEHHDAWGPCGPTPHIVMSQFFFLNELKNYKVQSKSTLSKHLHNITSLILCVQAVQCMCLQGAETHWLLLVTCCWCNSANEVA